MYFSSFFELKVSIDKGDVWTKKYPSADTTLAQMMAKLLRHERVITFAKTQEKTDWLLLEILKLKRLSCLLACHLNVKIFKGYGQETLPERNLETPQMIIY